MKIRNIIFWSHLSAGVTVGFVVLLMSITGMMLAFRPQIISSFEQGQYDSIDAKKNSPVRIFMKKVESWHRWFGLEGSLKPIARNFKGICTIIFSGMILTGVYLWWPYKKIKFEPAVSSKARNWNWHNAIGFWAAPFLMVIVVTGLLMLYLPRPEKPRAIKADIVKVEQTQDTPDRKFRRLIKTIHTGEAGGVAGQIIVFGASGAAVVLVWTGISMARQRFIQFRRKKHV